MTDDEIEDLDLELQPDSGEELGELEPLDDGDLAAAAPSPEPVPEPVVEQAAAAADPSAGGQWVWQYAAPPPPPSFGAAFFSGTAVIDLYRRFGASLLVVIGCLLPWGPAMETVPNDPAAIADGGAATIEQYSHAPTVPGVETPLGALSLLLGLWLMYASCHGIYTSRQKILPVFLMIEPAAVTWMLALDAWGKIEQPDTLQKIGELSEVLGTGVLMTLIGSTYVAGAFLFLFAKVFVKKDPEDKSAKRAAARAKKTDTSAEGDTKSEDGGDAEPDAKSDAKADAKAEGKGKAGKGGKGGRKRRR